jgi:chemotaxis protein MotB
VPALQGVVGKQIVIQGYTDNLPILPPLAERFPTNWAFSAARSVSVVTYRWRRGSIPTNYPRSRSGNIIPLDRTTRLKGVPGIAASIS